MKKSSAYERAKAALTESAPDPPWLVDYYGDSDDQPVSTVEDEARFKAERFAGFVRRERERRPNLTPAKAAAAIGKTEEWWELVESSEYHPDSTEARMIAKALGVSPDEALYWGGLVSEGPDGQVVRLILNYLTYVEIERHAEFLERLTEFAHTLMVDLAEAGSYHLPPRPELTRRPRRRG